MIPLPSIGMHGPSGANIAQFLHGVTKQKTSQAASKTGAPTVVTPASQGNSLINQIQQTVTNALQAAKAAGSTKDPNQIVEDSITSLLKNIFTGKTPPQSAPVSPQAFQNALKTAGISPQQFQNDLNTAVENVKNNLATTSLPTGSSLDVTG